MRSFLLNSTAMHAADKANGNGSADIYMDADDKIVKTPKDIAQAYRAMCTADTSHLSDAQVAAIVKSVHGDGNDVDVQQARVKAVESARPNVETHADAKGKPVTNNPAGLKTVSAGIPQKLEAMKYGKMIDADFVKTWDTAIKGKDDWEGGPILLEPLALKDFGKDAIRTMPEYGSGTKAWKEKHPGANGPFDHYEIDAIGGKDKSSYFEDMFDVTAPGERLALRSSQLNAVIKNQTHPEGTPEAYIAAATDEKALGAFAATLATKRRNYVKKLGMTIRLIQKRLDIEEQLPLVGVVFASMPNATAIPTAEQLRTISEQTLPFAMFDKGAAGGGRTKPFSVGTFLRLDVATAKANGGTVEALWATVKRAPKAAGGTPVPGATGASAEGLDIKVTNIKEFDAAQSALVGYMENDALMTMTHHGIQKKSDDVFPRLQNMFAMRGLIEGFCMKYETLYEELRVAKEAADKAAKGTPQREAA